MKRIPILLMTMAISLSAFSQHIITGTVKDNAGQAVPFATIRLYRSDNAHQLITGRIGDISGNFSMQADSTGGYKIAVSALGYEDTTVSFTLSSSKVSLDIILLKNQHLLAEVSVTATKPLITRRQTGIS